MQLISMWYDDKIQVTITNLSTIVFFTVSTNLVNSMIYKLSFYIKIKRMCNTIWYIIAIILGLARYNLLGQKWLLSIYGHMTFVQNHLYIIFNQYLKM